MVVKRSNCDQDLSVLLTSELIVQIIPLKHINWLSLHKRKERNLDRYINLLPCNRWFNWDADVDKTEFKQKMICCLKNTTVKIYCKLHFKNDSVSKSKKRAGRECGFWIMCPVRTFIYSQWIVITTMWGSLIYYM